MSANHLVDFVACEPFECPRDDERFTIENTRFGLWFCNERFAKIETEGSQIFDELSTIITVQKMVDRIGNDRSDFINVGNLFGGLF